MHLNTSELLKKYILKVLFVMPKFNPIFTFSKIYLKLTKKSSYFCIFKLFHKKYLNFIYLAPIFYLSHKKRPVRKNLYTGLCVLYKYYFVSKSG